MQYTYLYRHLLYDYHILISFQKVGNASVFGCIVLIGPHTSALRKRAGAIMERQTFKQKRESNDFVGR
jgi:hypothetical protein